MMKPARNDTGRTYATDEYPHSTMPIVGGKPA